METRKRKEGLVMNEWIALGLMGLGFLIGNLFQYTVQKEMTK